MSSEITEEQMMKWFKYEQYRLLKADERIEEGDEWQWQDGDPWHVPTWTRTVAHGELAPDPANPANRIYRRRVTIEREE